MFEPRVETIKEVVWDGEDRVLIKTGDGSGCWKGAKRKDFWNPADNWEALLVSGAVIRYWTVSWSIILGFELWIPEESKWRSVWCLANDFDTKAVSDARRKAYADFIEKEGILISALIDAGKNLEEIDKLIDQGHSGNTYACALSIGISKALNRDLAEKIRAAHNIKYGVVDGKGTVNPAVLTIKEKE